MHLDVTPTILINEHDPRLSCLHHAKPEEPPAKHERRLMNSYAFCEWFNALTPADIRFAQAYAKRAAAFDQMVIRADADVKPVPAHSTIEGGKSATVVALQLLKWNRNLRHEKRKGMRLPPSVMMAKIAAETLAPGGSIAGALEAIARAIQATLETAEREARLVEVRNPTCADEHFTDRWPENREAQRLYIADLKLLRDQLAALMSDRLMLDEKRDLLVAMFGEGPAQSTVDEYAASIGKAIRTGDRFVSPIGRVLPSAAAAPFILKSGPAQPRPHTFYGSQWTKK